jgi:hypothetical protein
MEALLNDIKANNLSKLCMFEAISDSTKFIKEKSMTHM